MRHLDVGLADGRVGESKQHFAGGGFGCRVVGVEAEVLLAVEDDCLHFRY